MLKHVQSSPHRHPISSDNLNEVNRKFRRSYDTDGKYSACRRLACSSPNSNMYDISKDKGTDGPKFDCLSLSNCANDLRINRRLGILSCTDFNISISSTSSTDNEVNTSTAEKRDLEINYPTNQNTSHIKNVDGYLGRNLDNRVSKNCLNCVSSPHHHSLYQNESCFTLDRRKSVVVECTERPKMLRNSLILFKRGSSTENAADAPQNFAKNGKFSSSFLHNSTKNDKFSTTLAPNHNTLIQNSTKNGNPIDASPNFTKNENPINATPNFTEKESRVSIRSDLNTSVNSSFSTSPEIKLDDTFNFPSLVQPVPALLHKNKNIIVRIWVRCLMQEMEYKTISLSYQTNSRQIVGHLLSKFRMKHRDHNLFYLTMEVNIRKAGTEVRTCLKLEDSSYPAQLLECHPHGNSRLALRMRRGGLIRIYDQEVCSGSYYKSLLVSEKITCSEIIKMILSCNNLDENDNNFSLFEINSCEKTQSLLQSDDQPMMIANDRKNRKMSIKFEVKRTQIDYELLNNSEVSSDVENSPSLTHVPEDCVENKHDSRNSNCSKSSRNEQMNFEKVQNCSENPAGYKNGENTIYQKLNCGKVLDPVTSVTGPIVELMKPDITESAIRNEKQLFDLINTGRSVLSESPDFIEKNEINKDFSGNNLKILSRNNENYLKNKEFSHLSSIINQNLDDNCSNYLNYLVLNQLMKPETLNTAEIISKSADNLDNSANNLEKLVNTLGKSVNNLEKSTDYVGIFINNCKNVDSTDYLKMSAVNCVENHDYAEISTLSTTANSESFLKEASTEIPTIHKPNKNSTIFHLNNTENSTKSILNGAIKPKLDLNDTQNFTEISTKKFTNYNQNKEENFKFSPPKLKNSTQPSTQPSTDEKYLENLKNSIKKENIRSRSEESLCRPTNLLGVQYMGKKYRKKLQSMETAEKKTEKIEFKTYNDYENYFYI